MNLNKDKKSSLLMTFLIVITVRIECQVLGPKFVQKTRKSFILASQLQCNNYRQHIITIHIPDFIIIKMVNNLIDQIVICMYI